MANVLSPRQIAALLALWIAALGAFVVWAVNHETDPMCSELASAFDVSCRMDLPIEAGLAPGALLDGSDKVVGRLDNAACLLPGASAIALPVRQQAGKSDRLPVLTYAVVQGRGISSIPAPATLFEPRARWSGLHAVGISVGGLSESSLDATRPAATDTACMLRTDCSGRIAEGEWRIVEDTVVASRVRYRFSGAGDRPFRVAAPGTVQDSEGGWFRLTGRHVVGVRMAAASTRAALSACAASIARSYRGHARVAVKGEGQRGALAPASIQQPFGKVALVSARGEEVSDCTPNLGRERSHAYAQAHLDSLADGGMRLAGEIRASSGRYRFGRCAVGRRLPTNNMLTNRATAELAIEGQMDLALRNSGQHTLEVRWSGAPAGMLLRITAPGGRPLIAAEAIRDGGKRRFQVQGPGLYRIAPSIRAEIERKGESGVKSFSFHAQLNADAWPLGSEPSAADQAAAAAEDSTASETDPPSSAEE